MPIQYSLRENGRIIHAMATGRYTTTEINETVARLAEDPELQGDHVTLFDTTKAESEGIDDPEFAEVFRMARLYPDKLVSRKIAILIKDKRFLRNAVAYQRLSAEIGEEVEIFSSLVEATNWLLVK